jgi:hypothetical protein
MIQGDLHVDSDIAPLTSPSEFFSSLLVLAPSGRLNGGGHGWAPLAIGIAGAAQEN